MYKISIDQVNTLSKEDFGSKFGNVIELHTEAAKEVEKKRPFVSVNQLCAAFQSYLDEVENDVKLRVLRLHPDLAGRLAEQGRLTQESSKEQQSAGLDQLTKDQKQIIQSCNESYKMKYGFPFIICVRKNKIPSIISGLQTRINNTKEQELVTGIEEVKKICSLRILDIVKS